jgi:glyceraldehyde-3-phosphate dehydrogenase/erythrose-4-phosphate dehydrogenase
MLKYDSTHGRFDGEVRHTLTLPRRPPLAPAAHAAGCLHNTRAQVSSTDSALVVNGRKIAVYAVMNAAEIPWRYAPNLFLMEAAAARLMSVQPS